MALVNLFSSDVKLKCLKFDCGLITVCSPFQIVAICC